jgi:hypothetical protein
MQENLFVTIYYNRRKSDDTMVDENHRMDWKAVLK